MVFFEAARNFSLHHLLPLFFRQKILSTIESKKLLVLQLPRQPPGILKLTACILTVSYVVYTGVSTWKNLSIISPGCEDNSETELSPLPCACRVG